MAVILLLCLFLAIPVQANEKVKFTPVIGVMWAQLSLWTLGLSVDLYISKNLAITPEFYMANREFGLKMSTDENQSDDKPSFILQPGVILNYHHPFFFVGAGWVSSIQRYWTYWNRKAHWPHLGKIKLNAGFKLEPIRLTASILFDLDEFPAYFPRNTTNQYCATIGITF